jgi:type II secretory pathway component PulK
MLAIPSGARLDFDGHCDRYALITAGMRVVMVAMMLRFVSMLCVGMLDDELPVNHREMS